MSVPRALLGPVVITYCQHVKQVDEMDRDVWVLSGQGERERIDQWMEVKHCLKESFV